MILLYFLHLLTGGFLMLTVCSKFAKELSILIVGQIGSCGGIWLYGTDNIKRET